MTIQRKRFDDCEEWEAVRHHPLVRYRPRLVPVAESFAVTLPVALQAVEGKLAGALGDAYCRCAALVGLRLGPGPSIGQLDLMLLTRSGAVALGECKLVAINSHFASVRRALRQVERYQKAIRGSRSIWLRERIEDSYDKFGFPRFGELLKALGVRSESDQHDWWATVSNSIRRGAFDTFLAIRTRGAATIDVWGRSKIRTH